MVLSAGKAATPVLPFPMTTISAERTEAAGAQVGTAAMPGEVASAMKESPPCSVPRFLGISEQAAPQRMVRKGAAVVLTAVRLEMAEAEAILSAVGSVPAGCCLF